MQPSQVARCSSKMQQSPKVLVTHSPTMRRQVRSLLRCVDRCRQKGHFFCKEGNYRVEFCFVFESEMYWQFLVCMSDNFPVQLDAQHISDFIFASGPARLGELASSPFIFSFLPRQPGNVGRWFFCKSLTNCLQHSIFSWVWFLWDLFSEEWNHQWPQVHTE